MKKDIWFRNKRIPAGIILVMAILLGVLCVRKALFTDAGLFQRDLEKLRTQQGNGLLCGNTSIDGISSEDFERYADVTLISYEKEVVKPEALKEILDAVLEERTEPIERVYLYLDPLSESENTVRKESYAGVISEAANAHCETEVYCLLVPHSQKRWISLSEEKLEWGVSTYEQWIAELSRIENVTILFPGAERWLIANPGNYSEADQLSPEILQKLSVDTFLAVQYEVRDDTCEEYLSILRGYLEDQKASTTAYPDLSLCDIVMFGDSIIGNYTDSSSVPGVVSGIAGTRCYNLGIGGLTASVAGDASFPVAASYFAQTVTEDNGGNVTAVPEGLASENTYMENVDRYLSDDHKGRILCFVINYGLNDYFTGMPVENAENLEDEMTYGGGLRAGIKILQEAFPEAEFLLCTPNAVKTFDWGREILSEEGSVLEKYAAEARKVAAECDLLCLDNYAELGITEDNWQVFLAPDLVHLNETGRYVMGERIAIAFGNQIH